ncbi:hypothetical protein COOONC_08887, partial [Cooperia oncophora]
MWHGGKPAPSAARPVPVKKMSTASAYEVPTAPPSGGSKTMVDDHALRRARFRSQGTTPSVSSSRGDRLDVSSCDSRRSSGISLPSRSISQDQRLYKGSLVTPASSRDSLSVASMTTEVSTDCCMKSSVA